MASSISPNQRSLKQVIDTSLLATKPRSHHREQFNITPSQSQKPPGGLSRVGQVQRYIGLEERASVTISIPLYICTIGSISSASRATSWNVISNSCSNAFILRRTDFACNANNCLIAVISSVCFFCGLSIFFCHF